MKNKGEKKKRKEKKRKGEALVSVRERECVV